jgi:hypothetical protein
MFPSKLSRRAAIMSGLVSGTFALALTASPAQAAQFNVGDKCSANMLGLQALLTPLHLQCVAGQIISTLPIPTPAPTSSAPAAAPSSQAPNPLASLAAGLTNTVNGLTSPVPALSPVSKAVSGAVSSLLAGSLPSTDPTAPGGATLPGVPGSTTTTGANGGTAKAGSPLTTASRKPSTKDGSSLLGPAAAFLPGASLASFADLSSSYGDLLPLADNIPSPLIASAEGKLAAVQAPLIAAGQQAANQADNGLFTRFGGKALPGLLVVLATAMVAAVGAGNLRAWQARFGGVNLKAWKRSTK